MTARWVMRPPLAGQAGVRLFCLPYAGGGASSYRVWADVLPPQIEVWPVQLPGREWRLKEPPHTRMAELVPALAEGLGPHLDGPFAVFGHSMGALVGFELCRFLRERGGPQPVRLFASGSPAPQLPPVRRTVGVSDEQFVQTLRALSGTPAEVLDNPELMALLLPVLRADFELCETYEADGAPPVDVPITALCGLEDPVAPRERMEPWADQTAAGFNLRMLPGGHFFVHTSPELVCRAVLQDLVA